MASFILGILGFTIDDSFIESFDKQRVYIFPHTTRFECIINCLALLAVDKRKYICFPVAQEYMETPILGSILSWFGAVKIIKGSNMVETISNHLKENRNKVIALSPEGSLSAKEWKSGFFHIAKNIGVPICVGGIDFVNHIILSNIDQEIIINENDTYEDRREEIEKMFSLSKIYPLYPESSYPQVIMDESLKTSYFDREWFSFLIFLFMIIVAIPLKFIYDTLIVLYGFVSLFF